MCLSEFRSVLCARARGLDRDLNNLQTPVSDRRSLGCWGQARWIRNQLYVGSHNLLVAGFDQFVDYANECINITWVATKTIEVSQIR